MDKTTKNILKALSKAHPDPTSELHYTNVFELLVATILSAQCTDKRINEIVASLYKKYPKLKDYANANIREFEKDIKLAGFYRVKAKNIVATANIIMNEYKGKVPNKIEELVKLPGIGRKSANIILYHGYGVVAGIAVDTHVKRLSKRLDLSKEAQPVKIEQNLMEIFPEKEWGKINGYLVLHGRYICKARNPLCGKCIINNYCIYYKERIK